MTSHIFIALGMWDDLVVANEKAIAVVNAARTKRGQPATFPVAGVIPGWTEALQLMKVGTKAQLVIPPELAYRSNGPLANQVLLFDVELLGAMATPVEEKGK